MLKGGPPFSGAGAGHRQVQSPYSLLMRRPIFLALLLVLATVAVYWPVSRHEFVNYDDPDYVTANARVQGGLSVEGVRWAFGQLHGEKTYWHPLTWLSHMLDCQLFGLQAGAHHLVNLLFHTLNVVLLFGLLVRSTGAVWRSALVAALFALHPLQVDTVAWVTERKNVLSTMFWLLTLWAYARYAQRPGPGLYLLALGCYALGLMAKPILVTLPCVLLLLDYWPLRRFPFSPASPAPAVPPSRHPPLALRSGLRWRITGRLLAEKLPFFALAGLISALTVLSHAGLGITQSGHGLPMVLRVENALVSYARYLGKVFWPADLAVLYPHPGAWPKWGVLGSALLVALLTAWVVRERKRSPWLAVGWFWFMGVLVPVIGLLQIGVQAMADRFAYVPLIGLFWALSWGGAALAGRWQRGPVLFAGLAGAAVLACAIVTAQQLSHWRNSFSLFEQALRATSNNYVIHNNLGYTLAQADRMEEATHHLQEAVRLKPDYVEARLQLGLVLEKQGKKGEALAQFRQVVRLRAGWPVALRVLAGAQARHGQTAEALETWRTLLRVRPADAEAHAQLGLLLSALPRTGDAIAHYRESLRLRPDSPETLNNLAWLLATHPDAQFRDGREAVQLAERACALTERKVAILIGTLAAAYAESGRFQDAVQTAREAAAVASVGGEEEVAAKNRQLMELYGTGKPYRGGTE